jgi:hypothetical protein
MTTITITTKILICFWVLAVICDCISVGKTLTAVSGYLYPWKTRNSEQSGIKYIRHDNGVKGPLKNSQRSYSTEDHERGLRMLSL